MQTANNLIFSSQASANGVWRKIDNWVAFSIHVTGVEAKVWIEVSNDPNVMTNGPAIAVPPAPVLSQYTPVVGSGAAGVAVNTTYYVQNTYLTPGQSANSSLSPSAILPIGETTPSTESSLLVVAGNLLVVAAPTADAGGYATGWNCYTSTVSGKEQLQGRALPMKGSFIQMNPTTSGFLVPTVNTTGSPNVGINVTPVDITTAGPENIDMSELVYDATSHQAIYSPSCLVYNYIRVCKSAASPAYTTNAFLFGQLG